MVLAQTRLLAQQIDDTESYSYFSKYGLSNKSANFLEASIVQRKKS